MSQFNTGHQSGGFTDIISVVPTVQAAAYASGDVLGGEMEIPFALRRGGGSGILQSITIGSKIALTVEMDVIILSESAAAANTTVTENGAVAIDAADADLVLGVVNINSTDDGYADLGTPDVVTKVNIGLPVFTADASRSLYAIIVPRGAHTPGSTSDLTVKFGIMQD